MDAGAKKARRKAYYAANREEIIAKQKAYAAANPEEVAAGRRARAGRDADKRKIKYAADPEKFLARSRAYHKANKEARNAQSRAYHEAHRVELKAYREANLWSEFGRLLWRRYKLTRDAWDGLLLAQSGRCAACLQALDGGKHTHVDHCHDTGKVRGLLCHPCNAAEGLLKSDPSLARALADYMELHANSPVHAGDALDT